MIIILLKFTYINLAISCTDCNHIFPKNNLNIEQIKITCLISQYIYKYLNGFILIKVKLQLVIFFFKSVFTFIKLILVNSPLSSPINNINSLSKLQHSLVISLLLKIIF